MPEGQKIEFSQLETGYEFPASSYQLDKSIVATYLKAVGSTDNLYRNGDLVPPMAIAAHAMAAMAENISLPPGTIHVSQGFEFRDTVTVDDALVSYARVSRKQSRRNLNLLTVDLNIVNHRQQTVLTGKTSFILPEPGGEGGR